MPDHSPETPPRRAPPCTRCRRSGGRRGRNTEGERMRENGQILVGRPEQWEHTHTCYTCQQSFVCTWAYCQAQVQRNCPACRTRARTPQEDPTDG